MNNATTDGPLFSRPGIEVSSRLIDLHGRTFAVRQINAVKVDVCGHPRALRLNLLCALSVCFFLFMGLVLLIVVTMPSNNQDDSIFWVIVGISLIFLMGALTVCTMAFHALQNLPKWGRLRFEMSNGSVKALDAEISHVQEVAAAIRQAMNQ